MEYQLVSQEGMGLAVGRCLVICYADNGMVVSQDTECTQVTLSVLTSILSWYRLVENVAKYKAMTCQLGALRYGMLEEAVGRQ